MSPGRPDAAWVDYEPKVAAVLGLETSDAAREDVRANIFGFTLVNDWSAHGASGDPLSTSEGLPLAIGPCVVTADDLDPQLMVMQVTIDGEELAKGNLNGAAENLYALISDASQDRDARAWRRVRARALRERRPRPLPASVARCADRAGRGGDRHAPQPPLAPLTSELRQDPARCGREGFPAWTSRGVVSIRPWTATGAGI